MELTREQALEMHQKMWINMLMVLGETGKGDSVTILSARCQFKGKWVKENYPQQIKDNCFLCEYAWQQYEKHHEEPFHYCNYCPVQWDAKRVIYACEYGSVKWFNSPISVILALPERLVGEAPAPEDPRTMEEFCFGMEGNPEDGSM